MKLVYAVEIGSRMKNVKIFSYATKCRENYNSKSTVTTSAPNVATFMVYISSPIAFLLATQLGNSNLDV